MYAKGHRVPVSGRMSSSPPSYVPPPPPPRGPYTPPPARRPPSGTAPPPPPRSSAPPPPPPSQCAEVSPGYNRAMKAGVLFLSCAMLAQSPAHAQTAWPSKPIRWIVPFPPGGPADIVTRIVSSKLAERTGQPNVVENRGGAGGNVGHEAAAKSPADGTTVLFVVPAVITNPYFLKASIDPFKELAPVIHLDSAWMVLLSTPSFPASTVADVIAQARARPGGVSCAASGALPQVGCEMLRAHAGADMIMVQYKGNAPALNAVMGGEVNLIFDLVNTSQGQVKAGRVRAIATTSAKRTSGPLGDLPTV